MNSKKAAFQIISLLLVSCIAGFKLKAQKNSGYLYQIRVYSLKDAQQEARVDTYLRNAWLPAVHRAGIKKAGVFKPLANDTAAIRKIYVLIPFRSAGDWFNLNGKLLHDQDYLAAGKDYLDAVYTDPPYSRLENIILRAFSEMPEPGSPDLKGPLGERIYELRSYEGATEKIHANKVQMFNTGDEVGLFKRLGFNAVFYAEVLAGARMPNLMYMTSFDNMVSHDEHWKSFGADPYWKKLSAMPEYQNNVSHIDIVLMHPAEYSDY